jgi:hypothetical protein
MDEIPVVDFDMIFVSYDEDNADDNWADIKQKCPWAKRVHGVYGSDAAHKAAAETADTDRFITCDADTIIKPEFLNAKISKGIAENMNTVVSWSSQNAVNGLIYGNGSLKCWTKPFVMSMKTHEESDKPKNRVEFCFEKGYTQRNQVLSTTYPNGSPRQAWRSGFREGVKMTLDQGLKIPIETLKSDMYWKNLIRLLVWCSVGIDSPYGAWCMYGARLGCYMTNLTDWDYINVRDFEYLNTMWNTEIANKFESIVSPHMCTTTGFCWDNDLLMDEINRLGSELRDHLDLEVADLGKNESRFFRKVFVNPARVDRRLK